MTKRTTIKTTASTTSVSSNGSVARRILTETHSTFSDLKVERTTAITKEAQGPERESMAINSECAPILPPPIFSLPEEVLERIALMLPMCDVATVAKTSTHLASLLDSVMFARLL
jgi:hypothetical protein